MKKSIAAAALAASLAAGGAAGAMLGVPGAAGAAETADGAVTWVQDALSGLVKDGTITQTQADKVETALEQARPERGFGHRAFGGGPLLSTVAETLGMTEADLRTELRDGKTIADVAKEKGVDVQKVIDALVAAEKAHLDQAVEAGRLTQAEADEMLANGTERATAMVNGELPRRGPGGFGRHGHSA